MGILLTTKGSGFVSDQSVKEGEKLNKKDKIEVTLDSEQLSVRTLLGKSKEKEDEG